MTEDPITATSTRASAGRPAAPAARNTATASRWLLVWLGLLALVWFASLGTRSLVHPDEGRYASLALEMARGGDWVTPRLNGLLYFEKPALQYWIGALSFLTFGVNEFAARLWPGIAGFLTVLAVGFTAGRLWGREAGIRALAIAASTTWIVVNSHYLTLDAGLTLFLTLALCAVLLADHAGADARTRRRWIWLAWAAMAGAVLSKGLVGIVIPGAVLVFVSLWRRDFSLWRRMHWLSGLLIFFVLTAPWFVLVSLRNPGFAQFFFIHEHFTRYLTEEHQREGAWWYYLPLLLAGMLPWTGALPWLLQDGRSAADRSARRVTPRHVLIVWSVFVLAFFSASGSKLPSYILPMFPALALLLAFRLRDVPAAVLRWHLLVPALAWVIVLVASTQSARFASPATPAEVLAPLASAARVGGALFLVGAAVAWRFLGNGRITAAVLSLALGHFAATTVVLQAHNDFGQLKSAASLAAVVRPLLDADTPVFAVRTYDQTLPFYLQRNVVLVDYVDEFALGEQREPGRTIATLDDFMARWRALPHAAAYMSPLTWVELHERGLPMRVVFQDLRRLVVVKP
ncbi:Undecaprenyl phosphate-alpha-4-amino-4-deoxy-L-arabinose arabinosyl transferase [Variovorax sp. SRS16]|uniref:glycosyltransferase family 39 protein n=1 Tax=Variovorax sp. SRS16 TaxID=282217 RepID=UPI001318AF98|nr:glycosyltransferase family 39 protein [Variovorax sp. SRS16]VTU22368.1 Undecaprenyl phosphate-alpha-4-amino-4-deoxy-L-arabinose arabinosyl transferase [Variovorax sp. SRS16]